MGHWGESAIWFGLACASAGLWTFVVEPRFLRGRLPTDRYHEHLRSPEWAATWAELETKRRGRRCAACGATDDLGDPHHWTYCNLGYESLWQLVRLCRRHHRRVHQVSDWWFSERTRALWVTTPLVIVCTRLLGRRIPQHATR